jgi:hypothetical protein
MLAWINDYTDASGKDAATLLSFSPNLHIILAGSERNYKALHSVGIVCPKCRKTVEGRNLFPVPKDFRILGCDCVMVMFGARAFPHDFIVEHWDNWRLIKAQAESQLSAGAN